MKKPTEANGHSLAFSLQTNSPMQKRHADHSVQMLNSNILEGAVGSKYEVALAVIKLANRSLKRFEISLLPPKSHASSSMLIYKEVQRSLGCCKPS